MVLVNWEFLRKGQMDNEKIEEAIARLIVAHRADESAHLGVGESLQSHKASQIIDHLAASIFADKMATKETKITTNFESIVAWTSFFTPPILSWPGVRFQTGVGAGDKSDLLSTESGPFSSDEFLDNFIVQFLAFMNSPSPWQAYLMAGNCFEGEDGAGLGFRIINTHAYGIIKNWTSYNEVDLGPFVQGHYHTFRIQIFTVEGVIRWYIDGVELGVYAIPVLIDSAEMGAWFQIEHISGAASAIMYLAPFFVSADTLL